VIPADTPAGSYVLHTMNDGTETPGHTLGLPSQIAGRWGVPVLLDNGMRLVHCNLERFQPAQLTLGI
jgi:hypothetical protein